MLVLISQCLSSRTERFPAWWSLYIQQRQCTAAHVCWAYCLVSFLCPRWHHNRFRTAGLDHWCLVYRLRTVKLLRWDNGFEITHLNSLFSIEIIIHVTFSEHFSHLPPIGWSSPTYKLMQLFEFTLKWSMFHYRPTVIHFSMESASKRFNET